MSHTYTQNALHIVFTTKGRSRFIAEDWQSHLWAYVAGICKRFDIHVHAIGGMADHIHLLIQIPASLALADAVRAIKSNSSRWARENFHEFAWQEGYAAFSVSHSLVPVAVRYIRDQKQHHQKSGFDAEFLVLLKKHGVECDGEFMFG